MSHLWGSTSLKTQTNHSQPIPPKSPRIKTIFARINDVQLCVIFCHLFLFHLLLDMLLLVGFFHHLAVDHRLSYHLHNLPGANVRLF